MQETVKNNILNVIKSCETLQFCTFALNKYPETRTIANFINKDREIDDNLTLYFLTNTHTHKAEQIRKNNNVCLYYFNGNTRKSMTLFGEVEEVKDLKTRNSFWRDGWKDLGYTGKDDSDYVIIKFIPKIYKYYTGKMEEYTGSL